MKKVLTNGFIVAALRLFIGGWFILFAFGKIANPTEFCIAIDNYHFLPESLVAFWAVMLPWVELVVGLFLVLGVFVEASALISALLFFSFTIALGYAVAKGFDISCGCKSGDESKINFWYVVRDFTLILACLWIMFGYRGKLALEGLWIKRTTLK